MTAATLSLEDRIRAADRIVVGTVTRVTRGELRSDGEAIGKYVLATVSVAESLKPQDDATDVSPSTTTTATPW